MHSSDDKTKLGRTDTVRAGLVSFTLLYKLQNKSVSAATAPLLLQLPCFSQICLEEQEVAYA